MYLKSLALLFSILSTPVFAGPLQDLILNKLSLSLPDSNSRSVSNTFDMCSISVSNGSDGFYLTIKKKYEGLRCQSNFGATFSFDRESDCKIDSYGAKQTIKCLSVSCESAGCTEFRSELTIEGKVFRIGNVVCDLGRRSRTGEGDKDCHP